MSVASEFEIERQLITNAYNKLDDLGIDLTNVDKNIDNIAEMLDTVYEEYPKVTGTGTEVTLDGTKVGKLGLDIKGNSTQETTTGKNLLNPNVINGTKNGITYSYDSDTQIYTFNGTCTADNTLINSIAKEVIEFTNGTTTVSVHYVSGSATGGKVQFLTSGYAGTTVDFANISSSSPIKSQVATSTYTPTLFNSRIIFNNGFVLNNLKIKIMVANSTDTSYEPYTGGIASPNPSYPQEIYSAGDNGSISEKIVNKNLYNPSKAHKSGNGNQNIGFDFTNLKQGQTYIFNTVDRLYTHVSLYNSNNVITRTLGNTQTTYSVTFTPTSSEVKALCGFYVGSNVSVATYDFTNIQLEEGSTTTTYTAHQEQTYTIPTQQPMRSIGNVRDEFIKVNGEWKERHYIKEIILDGTENWQDRTGTSLWYIATTDRTSINTNQLCLSQFYEGTVAINVDQPNYTIKSGRISPYINIFIKDTRYSSANDFKAWLSQQYNNNNPVKVCYILETPTDLPCTEEQISILENLPKSYNKQTNIYSFDVTPAYIEAKALKGE